MEPLRIESIGYDNEVVDFIDLTGDISTEKLLQARQVIRARAAIEMGDLSLMDTIKLDLHVSKAQIRA